MRVLRSLVGISSLLALALALVGAPAVTARATGSVPKVVIVVGPSGDATDGYRAAARAAADVARDYTPDVVEILSPNATWPAARKALQDASVVVYLGHGNGWPSRYRPSLYPPTQNGLGLNPVAGVDDVAHQYFGEAYLAGDVKLAPNAVVVLSHLCYASGNSEPGLPEGTLDVARQRVDNFAAGWIAAGARAVVAEAYLDPAYYVRSLLAGRGSISGAWYSGPTFHDHVVQFPSERQPGFVDLLDPTTARGTGFSRSLVIRGSVSSAQVVASGRGSAAGGVVVPPAPPAPTLASVGARVDAPELAGLPVAGTTRTLTLPITLPAAAPASLVDGLQLSVRWDPLDVRTAVAPDAAPGGADPSVAPTQPPHGQGGGPAASPADGPGATDGAVTPDDPFALVVPEVAGAVVDPVKATRVASGWRIRTAVPTAPGLYALAVGLHGSDAVAFDAASQALVPRLLVRVVGPHSATVVAPSEVEATTQETFTLPVGVRNSGSDAWAAPQPADPRPGTALELVGPVRVTARWVALAGAQGDGRDGSFEVHRTIRSGDRLDARIPLVAPSAPGSWLLVVDIETPETASLVAAGSPATVVRVNVSQAPDDDAAGPPRP